MEFKAKVLVYVTCFMESSDQQGEMKITAFNNEVDKFFSLVEQGKVSQVPLSTGLQNVKSHIFQNVGGLIP